MTMFMTGTNVKGEILTGPERRRRWSPAEKVAIVQETYEPGVTVSLVARRHGLSPAQLFAWRRLASQGALTATGTAKVAVAHDGVVKVRAARVNTTEIAPAQIGET